MGGPHCYAVRRVRKKAPDVFILVALLENQLEIDEQENSIKTEFVRQSLGGPVEKIIAMARFREIDSPDLAASRH
jgi:hypothetical protein